MKINLKYGTGTVEIFLNKYTSVSPDKKLTGRFNPEEFYFDFAGKILQKKLSGRKIAAW